jgi:acetyltransferase
VLAADHADDVGLDVHRPSPKAQRALSGFLPRHCPLDNPIDLTVEGTEAGYRDTLRTVLPEYDAAVALNIAPPYLDSVSLARGIADAAAGTGCPVVASFLPGWIVADGIAELRKRGIPNIATGERAVTTLAHMAHYQERRARIRPFPATPGRRADEIGAGWVSEPEAMRWLKSNGIPVPDFRFASDRKEAVEACRQIGYPVVMKVVSPDVLHKSDEGGVVLGIGDDGAALQAYSSISAAVRGKELRGVVIYPMIQGAMEMLVGLSRDAQFGPVVACGLGGVYTEVWRDISLRVAPVDSQEASGMLRDLRSFPLLEGARGQETADLGALTDLLVNFSQLPFLYPDIAEVDLNPVFLLSKGLVAADVRVLRKTD